jgi:hypothetical protein
LIGCDPQCHYLTFADRYLGDLFSSWGDYTLRERDSRVLKGNAF